jgi:hypothetical protein
MYSKMASLTASIVTGIGRVRVMPVKFRTFESGNLNRPGASQLRRCDLDQLLFFDSTHLLEFVDIEVPSRTPLGNRDVAEPRCHNPGTDGNKC